MNRLRFATGVALLSFAFLAQAQNFKVVDHWHVGGQGGWDYLLSDDAAHRLYLSHNARVEVVDTSTGKPIGGVTGMKSTHGIALNTDGKTGYISDGAGNGIVVFDRQTLAVKNTVPAGTNPDGITFEPATRTVWAFNGRSNNVSVMDAATETIVATIALPGKPEFPQVDGDGSVFVNIEDKNEIVKLDAKSKQIKAEWKLQGCESPSGMAMDRSKKRLFSVCDGKKMAIIDYTSGKVLGLASIGDSPDAAGFDPKSGLAFSSNGDGTLSIVDTGKPGFPTVQTVATQRGGRTMSFDAASGRVYIVTAKYGPAPAATATSPRPRPAVLPDSFEVLVVGR